MRDGAIEADQGFIDLLLSINDALQHYLAGYRTNSEVKGDERLLERIECLMAVSGNGSEPSSGPAPNPGSSGAASVYDITVVFDSKCDMKTSGANLIIERLSTKGELIYMDPPSAPGASILGNGKVVLILDAPALIAREMRREAAKA